MHAIKRVAFHFHTGFGVFATDNFERGSFLLEYRGSLTFDLLSAQSIPIGETKSERPQAPDMQEIAARQAVAELLIRTENWNHRQPHPI